MKLKRSIIAAFTVMLFICLLFIVMGFNLKSANNSPVMADHEEKIQKAQAVEEQKINERVTMEVDIDNRLRTGDFRNMPHYKFVFLTFNEGPDECSNEVLDILKENHVKATFFVTGRKDDLGDGVYRRIFNEGHVLGNHTFTHPTDLSNIKVEMDSLYDYMKMVIEDEPARVFRFPENANVTQKDIQAVRDNGYNYFESNVNVTELNSNQDVQSVLNEIHNEIDPVVAFNIEKAEDKESLPYLDKLIKSLKKEDYTFMVLDPNYNIVK